MWPESLESTSACSGAKIFTGCCDREDCMSQLAGDPLRGVIVPVAHAEESLRVPEENK